MSVRVRDDSRRCRIAVLKAVLRVVVGSGVCHKSEIPAELSRTLLAKLFAVPESLSAEFHGK